MGKKKTSFIDRIIGTTSSGNIVLKGQNRNLIPLEINTKISGKIPEFTKNARAKKTETNERKTVNECYRMKQRQKNLLLSYFGQH